MSGCTSVEDEQWERAERRDSVYYYKEFAKQHPDSKNANVANQRVAELHAKNEKSKFEKIDIGERSAEKLIKQYLRDYPDGSHHAKVLLMQDEMHFNSAQKGNSENSYSKYLEQYPKGSFVSEAKTALVNIQEARMNHLYDQAIISRNYNTVTNFINEYPNNSNILKLQARQNRFEKIVTKEAQNVSYKTLGWREPITGEELMKRDKEDEKNRFLNMHGNMTGSYVFFPSESLNILLGNGSMPGIEITLEPVNISYKSLFKDAASITSISKNGWFSINSQLVLLVGSTLNITSVYVNGGLVNEGVITLGEKNAVLNAGAIQYLFND